MTTFRSRTVAALVLASLPLAVVAGPAAAAPTTLLPDDLAFLDSEAVDDLVAASENGSADCAALQAVMGIGLIAAFASSDFDFGDSSDSAPPSTEAMITPQAFWAVSAPLLVPLLDRANAEDPAAAAFVDIVGPQLVGAIYELRDLGFTDDELLLIQESFATEMLIDEDSESETTLAVPEDSALADLEARAEQLLTYEFESITFLDEDAAEGLPGEEDDALPWADDCPETAALFEFDMEPVSATIDFEVTITVP